LNLAGTLVGCLGLLAQGILPGTSAAAEPIVVVQVLDITADENQRAALQLHYGVEVATAQLNAQGGVLGRPLRVLTLPHGGDPARAAAAVRRTVREQRAVAVLHCIGEAVCRAVAEAADEMQVPLIAPIAGGRYFARGMAPQVFRVRAGYERQAEALAQQFRAVTVVQRVALVSDATEGERTLAFRDGLRKEGLEVAVLPLAPGNRADFEALMKTLATGHYQAAALDVRPDTVEHMARQKMDRRPEWPAMLAGVSDVAVSSLLGFFPQRVFAYNTVVPDPERTVIPAVADLQRAADRYSRVEAATTSGLEGLLDLRLLTEGLRRAGKADPAALRNALDGMGQVDLGGFFVSFAPGRPSGSAFVEVRLRPRLAAR
jgi:ABC-type branched-subunit amino acid transport system substrate-binding protein